VPYHATILYRVLAGAALSFPLPLGLITALIQISPRGRLTLTSLPRVSLRAIHFQPHSGLDFQAVPVSINIKSYYIPSAEGASYHIPWQQTSFSTRQWIRRAGTGMVATQPQPPHLSRQNHRTESEVGSWIFGSRPKYREVNPVPYHASILYRGTCRRRLVFPTTPRINHSVDPNFASGPIDIRILSPSC